MDYKHRMQRIIRTDELFNASKRLRKAFLETTERTMKRVMLKRLGEHYDK